MKRGEPNTSILCDDCDKAEPLRQDDGAVVTLHSCGGDCDCLPCLQERYAS